MMVDAGRSGGGGPRSPRRGVSWMLGLALALPPLLLIACNGCGESGSRSRSTGGGLRYPLDLTWHELRNWVLSPDRTAAFPRCPIQRPGVAQAMRVLDLKSGTTLQVAALGSPFAWSADSTRILYWNAGWCSVRRDGQEHLRFASDFGARMTPLPRPGTGEFLVYDAERIRLISGDGKTDRQICTFQQVPRMKGAFLWSPDGQWLHYYTASSGSQTFGFISADGTAHRSVLAADKKKEPIFPYTLPKWSSDGKKVHFIAKTGWHGPNQVWAWDLKTGTPKALANVDGILPGAALLKVPAWAVAPDESLVATSAKALSSALALQDTRTGARHKIHPTGGVAQICFAPDGKRLAVRLSAQGILLLDLATLKGVIVRMANILKTTIRGWTDDGSALVLDGESLMVFEIDADGSAARLVWPNDCEMESTREEVSYQRIPLEQEATVPCTAKPFAVELAAKDLAPAVKPLPVQVIELEVQPGR